MQPKDTRDGGSPATAVMFMAQPSLKGRGTAWAIEHRFTSHRHESADDGWGALDQAAHDAMAPPGTQITEQRVKTILSGNDSPDIPFDLSINPYRGCEHGCVYCFARPTHSYLNLSPGLDFETKIMAKVNAAERLRDAFASGSYRPMPLNIGSATDAYQPAERRLRITRSLIEVLAEHRHAFSIITKSSAIERDIDLLAPLARDRLVSVYISIPSLDGALARVMEPRATAPTRRLRTMDRLARVGIPVGVSVSPVILFLNEPELERVLEQARDAGATAAFATALRLPWEVNPLFQQWLRRHFPDRAARVMARVRDMRGGRDNDSRFGQRMTGTGVWAQLLAQRLRAASQRLGLGQERIALDLSQFRRPSTSVERPAQSSLF
jgi:DNA repair photolyase